MESHVRGRPLHALWCLTTLVIGDVRYNFLGILWMHGQSTSLPATFEAFDKPTYGMGGVCAFDATDIPIGR